MAYSTAISQNVKIDEHDSDESSEEVTEYVVEVLPPSAFFVEYNTDNLKETQSEQSYISQPIDSSIVQTVLEH